jgi:H+/gluconate symporter-like permease
MDRIGARHAAMGVVAACAILTYGGVSVFVVAFSVYPTALVLFRAADLPRRFIPGCLAFGSVTFTMTTAGSPEIQNWIPIQFLNTSPWAAWEASFVTAAFMAVTGTWLLNRLLRRARENGERFTARPGDPEASGRDLPPVWRAFMGPVTVLVVSFSLHARLGTSALIVSLLAGVLVVGGFCWRHRQNPGVALSQGALGALVAIGNTAAVVGFGAVAKNAPAFISGVEWLTSTGVGGVTGAALAVAVICAITGSASGGQAVALPLLAPGFLASGVDPNQLHRAVAIASGGLDSLPHNGYVVTTIRAICGESHRDAYGPVGWLTVVVPFLGLWVCLLLFGLGL